MTPNGFDRLARPYRWMEYLSFGPLLQRCRTRYLPQLAHVRNALVLGDGDGRFTAQLLHTAASAHVTAVDGSSAMLTQLLHNCGANAKRVTTRQAILPGGLSNTAQGQTYDLVATHFFLDCLTTAEVEQLAQALRPHLAEDACWVISDFAIAHGTLQLPSKLLAAALYRAFRILTGLQTQQLPNHGAALAASGLTRIQRSTMLGGLLVSERWQPAAAADRIVKER